MSESSSRLREWSRDDLHVTQSVRFHEPVYANPTEIRRDVREILAALAACEAREATLWRELRHANFFRDKLAERLTLVETAVVELEGALGCDEATDPQHWRDHARHAMTSALDLCRQATRVGEGPQT